MRTARPYGSEPFIDDNSTAASTPANYIARLGGALMPDTKRSWWAQAWDKRAFATPRVAVLHAAMNTTPRPSAPGESIAYGYMHNRKLHDGEPAALLRAVVALDSGFFLTYPRKRTEALDETKLCAAIGEAARAFYRHGLHAYGRPAQAADDAPLDCLPCLPSDESEG